MNRLSCAALLFIAACGRASAGPVEKLADKLANAIKDRPAARLAVADFSYTGGKSSEGPEVIQERLITALGRQKGISLIERGLLKKVFLEMRLQASGAMDETNAKSLGRLAGADIIVLGTLNDISGEETEINARLVETRTGRIITTESATVKRTWKNAETEKRSKLNGAFYLGADALLPTNISYAANSVADADKAAFGGSYKTSEAAFGYGLRLAYRRKARETFEFGPGLGIYAGPRTTITYAQDPAHIPAKAGYIFKREVYYTRFTLEGLKRFPLSAGASLILGAGAGFGLGKAAFDTNGFLEEHSWTGLTLDASAGFEGGNFSFGGRYIYFPKYTPSPDDGLNDIREIYWNGLGFFAALKL